ncbi:MAG: LysR family transcriptional regulator [Deltaproteobacteria bacterium]|nr:LysR family transcriptional regulator [Deltaproteobacteria bacterium]HDZ91958.1 LysR family transcriptional regulator [Deltaproteobacteria bacterium]
MLNFNQLRTFCVAARHGSFTAAARKLYVTQPAVTSQIKLLEEQCGLKLFKKMGRKVYLTDEGKTLYEYVHKVFDYEKEIEDVMEEMRELKRGVLRLGTTKTYARYFMPLMITGFRETYPQIQIHLDEGSSKDMTLSLLDFQNEIAIIAKAVDHPRICFFPFGEEEVVLIAAPDHHLTNETPVTFDSISREPIIMKETGSGTRRLVNNIFAMNNCSPFVLMETGNTEFIKQLVQRGDGISFLVREAVAVEVREGRLTTLPLEGHRLRLDMSVAYLKDQHLSPPARAFLDILGKLAPREMLPQGIGALTARMLSQRR